jgi:hypothetical protein
MRCRASSKASATAGVTSARAPSRIGIGTRNFEMSCRSSSKRRVYSTSAASPRARDVGENLRDRRQSSLRASNPSRRVAAKRKRARRPDDLHAKRHPRARSRRPSRRSARARRARDDRPQSLARGACDGPSACMRPGRPGPFVDQRREPVDLIAVEPTSTCHSRGRRIRGRTRARYRARTPFTSFALTESSTGGFFAGCRARPLAQAQPAPSPRGFRIAETGLLHLRIHFREDDHIAGAGGIFELRDEHLLARLGERAAHRGHHAGHGHERVVVDRRADPSSASRRRAPADACTSASGCPETKMPSVSFSHASISRVLGAAIIGGNRRQRGACSLGCGHRRARPARVLFRASRAPRDRAPHRGRPDLRAVARKFVERAALDQRFEDAPVHLLGIDALGKIEEIGELSVRLARVDDASHRAFTDALDAARPKRMRSPTTAKSTSDSLMSGGST